MENNKIHSSLSINHIDQKQSNETKSHDLESFDESLFVVRQLANLDLQFEIDRVNANKYIEKYSSNKNEIEFGESLINLFRENVK
jgi:hypothetical protein